MLQRNCKPAGRALLQASALLGIAAGAAIAFARPALAQGWPPPRIVLSPCAIDGVQAAADCGTVEVPENRAAAAARSISLKLIVLRARRAPNPLPLFYLAGGPGLAATNEAPRLSRSWESEHNDIVLLDARGTGDGNRLDCRPDEGASAQALADPYFTDIDALARCVARLRRSADLTRYRTPDIVHDLDQVRRALGYGRINLEGSSFGTRIALAYLHLHAAHVHAALLSGLVPAENRVPLYHARAAQRAFDAWSRHCVRDRSCIGLGGYPGRAMRRIGVALDRAPARVDVVNPLSGGAETIDVSHAAFAEAVRGLLYSCEGRRRLPAMLKAAFDGDFRPTASVLLAAGKLRYERLSIGAMLAASCAEDVARIRASEIGPSSRGSFLGAFRIAAQVRACALWPKSAMPVDYFGRWRSRVPAILVSGALDPVTPPQWGRIAQRYLLNSRRIVTGNGHVEGDSRVAIAAARLFGA